MRAHLYLWGATGVYRCISSFLYYRFYSRTWFSFITPQRNVSGSFELLTELALVVEMPYPPHDEE